MISAHLSDLRRADVETSPLGGAFLVLRIGAYDRVTITVPSEVKARIIAEAINAGLGSLSSSILDKRPGGA